MCRAGRRRSGRFLDPAPEGVGPHLGLFLLRRATSLEEFGRLAENVSVHNEYLLHGTNEDDHIGSKGRPEVKISTKASLPFVTEFLLT